jgi:hypothetical protein
MLTKLRPENLKERNLGEEKKLNGFGRIRLD